jgi:hypothetical protein
MEKLINMREEAHVSNAVLLFDEFDSVAFSRSVG